MVNTSQKYIGWILIGFGLVILMDKLLDISLWHTIWPLVFIGLGVWLLTRSKQTKSDVVTRKIFGDINRSGSWKLANEEILFGIGDVNLDLTRAEIPQGETNLRIMGLIGDVDFVLPQNLGVSVTTKGLIIESKILGNHQEKFFSSTNTQSKNFTQSKKQLMIEISLLAGDVSIQRVDK